MKISDPKIWVIKILPEDAMKLLNLKDDEFYADIWKRKPQLISLFRKLIDERRNETYEVVFNYEGFETREIVA